MIYYKLESQFEGDVTKNCGLTIDEVDGNFYELETTLYELGKQVEECCKKLGRETFYIDSLPFSDDTNKDTVFTKVGGEDDTYEICGKIGYDYTKDGNFVKLALAPNVYNLKRKYPNARYTVLNDALCDTSHVKTKNLWDTYDENENVFLFDVCVKDGGDIYLLGIEWDDSETEYYTYLVCDDIDLEKRVYHFSRTCHDTEICPPGTSNEATYTLDAKGYDMTVCGKIDYSKDILPNNQEKGNRFGVAIVPLKDETEMYTDLNELEALYPNAEFFIGSNNMGSIYDEIRSNDPSWPLALYMYPKVSKVDDEIVVELGGYKGCENSISISVKWDDETVETYNYTVCEDIELEKREYIGRTCHDAEVCPPGTSNNATYTFVNPTNTVMEIGGEIDYSSDILPNGQEKGNRFGITIIPFKPNTNEEYGTIGESIDQFNTDYPNAMFRINDSEWYSLNNELVDTESDWKLGLYFYPKVVREDGVLNVSLAGNGNGGSTLSMTIRLNDTLEEKFIYKVREDVVLKNKE